MNWPHFGYFNARLRVLKNVAFEVATVTTGVNEQTFSAFIDVDQRQHVRPSVHANGGHVSHFLRSEKGSGFFVAHQTIGPVHVPARVSGVAHRTLSVLGPSSEWPGT